MAWTWEDILTDSLSLSGILGQGQIANAQMISSAKQRASRLLDKLDGKGISLPVFSIDVVFNTVSDQERYVLGVGTDPSPASNIRPETIINGQLQIQGGSQPTYLPLIKKDFPNYRDDILVPRNLSQPIYYSLNPSWPQAELYLWPVPNQVWQVRFTCRVKWIDVVTNPQTNTFSYAQLPSGYTNAFTDMLAYELAMWRRLSTDDLKDKARDGEYLMTQQSWYTPDIPSETGTAFPWDITRAGMNPG
jgi:hypothetical protein